MKKIYLFNKILFYIFAFIPLVILLGFLSLLFVYFNERKEVVLYFNLIMLIFQIIAYFWLFFRLRKNRCYIVEKGKIIFNEVIQDENGLLIFKKQEILKINIKGIERHSFFNNKITYFQDDIKKELLFVSTQKTFNRIKEILNLL